MTAVPAAKEPPRPRKEAPAPVPLVGDGALAPRREAFSRLYAAGLPAAAAARLAGFPWQAATACARALLDEPAVAARVSEIALACRARREGLRQWILARLMRLADSALVAGDRTLALRALTRLQGCEQEPADPLSDRLAADLGTGAPAGPADLAEDGPPPAMPPLPLSYVALRGPLDSPETLEGVSDVLEKVKFWMPEIKRHDAALQAVREQLTANNERLPDDFDVREFALGVPVWYRDELIERRRARGLDPIDGKPLRTPAGPHDPHAAPTPAGRTPT